MKNKFQNLFKTIIHSSKSLLLNNKINLGLLLFVIFLFTYNLSNPPTVKIAAPLPNVNVDFNGISNVDIPIELPPSEGMSPNLSLSYRSNSGNGYLGKGWYIPTFQTVNAIFDDAGKATYSSSYTGILLDISGAGTEYRAKTEIFAKITPSAAADCGLGPCSWTIRTNTGIKFSFGSSANSRLLIPGKSEVREWLLDRVEDANGNAYSISYTLDSLAGFAYPNSINFLDKIIQFNYAIRTDINKEYSNTATNPMNSICTGITVTSAGELFKQYDFAYTIGTDKISLLSTVSQTGLKDISITYTTGNNATTRLTALPVTTNVDYKVPFFNQGKCAEVRNHCSCTAIPGCAEAVLQATLGIIDSQTECANGTVSLGDLCTNGMQTGPFSVTTDVNGDGKADIVKIIGGVDNYRIQVLTLNESGGTETNLSPPMQLRINSFISMGDVNGDGKLELLYAEDNNHNLKVAYYDLNSKAYTNIHTIPNIQIDTLGYNPDDIKLTSRNFPTDMNGDKRTDFVRIYDTGNDTRLKISILNGTTTNGTIFETPYDITVPNIGSENTSRFFMDTNGDGKPEWVQMQNENPKSLKISALNLATKTATTKTLNFDLSGGAARHTNIKNISFTDINGDGKVDLSAILDDGQISIVLGTENGFSAASISNLSVKPEFLPTGDNSFQAIQNTVSYSDMNGDRKDDLVFSKNGNLYIAYSNGKGFNSIDSTKPFEGAFQLADVNGDKKADIIGLGLTEKPKTPIFTIQAFRIDSDTPPEYTGNAKLLVEASSKSPSDLIEKISNNEGSEVNLTYKMNTDLPKTAYPNTAVYPILPDLTPEYLVTVKITDAGAGQPQNKEVFEYEDRKIIAGADAISGDLGFKKVIKATSLLTTSGEVPVNKIITDLHQDNILAKGSIKKTTILNEVGGTQQVFDYQYESGTTALGTNYFREKNISNSIFENNQFLFTNTNTKYYDSYGNIEREVSNTEGKIEETLRTYNPDPANWFLNRLTNSKTLKEGEIIENVNYTYSGFNLESSSVEIEPSKWSTTTFAYDSLGRISSETKPTGKTVSYTYDTNSNLTSVSDASGKSMRVEYDLASGNVQKQIGLNGEVTEFKYDYFGRVTEIINPDAIDWSEKIIYSDDPNDTYIEKRTNTSFSNGFLLFIPIAMQGGSSYTWTREYQNKSGDRTKLQTSLKDGKVSQVDFNYDSSGNLISESNPYIVGEETPQFTTINYGVNGRITSKVFSNGKENRFSMNNLVYTDSLTGRETITSKRDIEGRYTEISHGNLKNKYEYYPNGKVKKIYDPQNGLTQLSYNRRGNITSLTNTNSGKKDFVHSLEGKVESEKDANGNLIQYFYDEYLRLIKKITPDETISYTYDDSGANSLGKLTSITDSSGFSKFFYDKNGNIVKTIRKFDDFVIQFQNRYDSKNRLIQRVYPDATIASYTYDNDELINIKVSSGDGKVSNEKLVEYINDKPNNKLFKKYGNGVQTEIAYDPISARELSTKTTTARQSIEEHKIYNYDQNDNISAILDMTNPSKNQEFSFDNFNRLTLAKGKYGEESYTYTDNGNLQKKGDLNYTYADSSHPHAVTSLQKPFETIQFEYDAAGNITKKNNDLYTHNALGQLTSIRTADGKEFNYIYNQSGNRVKKLDRNTGEVTYYFEDGLYEIHKYPGRADEHTIYFKEGTGSIAQWTRTDAVLPNIDLSASSLQENKTPKDFTLAVKIILNAISIAAFLFILTLGKNQKMKWAYAFKLSVVSLLLLTCTGSNKKGLPFAALMLSKGVNSETPSIGGEATPSAGSAQIGSGGASSAGTPVSGFYFLHRNYLDSVTMVTDGKGEMVSGMDLGTGKSVIDYKPYGEIDRKNSDGPDIFRYKYTGQEEDRETGLYYYKARYYDPELGRFLQADSYINPNSPFGLNQYMYVEGNPIAFNDPSGHKRRWNGSRRYTGMNAKLRTIGTNIGQATKALLGQKERRHEGGRINVGKAWDRAFGFLSPSNHIPQRPIDLIRRNPIGAYFAAENRRNRQPEGDDITSPCHISKQENTAESAVLPEVMIAPDESILDTYPLSPVYVNPPCDRLLPAFNVTSHEYNRIINQPFGDTSRIRELIVVRTNRSVWPWDICKFDQVGQQHCTYNGGALAFEREDKTTAQQQFFKCGRSNLQQKPVGSETANSYYANGGSCATAK